MPPDEYRWPTTPSAPLCRARCLGERHYSVGRRSGAVKLLVPFSTATTSSLPVTLSITPGTSTPGTSLLGTIVVNAIAGVVRFVGLYVNSEGSGPTLTASSPDHSPPPAHGPMYSGPFHLRTSPCGVCSVWPGPSWRWMRGALGCGALGVAHPTWSTHP